MDGLRHGAEHVRNRPLNFIAGNCGISLGTPVARNPCTSSGDSQLHWPVVLLGLM